MNKICTSIEQSRKLLELVIDINTADMCWSVDIPNSPTLLSYPITDCDNWEHKIPAWSLTALLEVLPKIVKHETLFIETSASLWHIGYRNIYIARADDLLDACVELIIKLKEQNLI